MFASARAIAKRELIGALRGRNTGIAVIVFTTIGAYLVFHSVVDWHDPYGYIAFGEMGRMSRGICSGMSHLMLAMMWLGLPYVTGASIVHERERNTLELVLLAPVRPRDVVLGKCLAALAYAGLMIGAVLPLAAAAFFLVGIAWQPFLLAFLVIGAFAVCATCAGVWASARSKTVRRGTGLAGFLAFLFVALGGWLLAIGSSVASYRLGWPELPEPILAALIPFYSINEAYRPTLGHLHWILVGSAAWLLAASVPFFLLAARATARYGRERRWFTRRKQTQGNAETAKARAPRLVKPGQNPFYRLQRLRGGICSNRAVYLAAAAPLLLLLWIGFTARRVEPNADGLVHILLALGVIGLLVLAGHGAAQFTRERDRDTWDQIRLTTASPWRVFAGKAKAAMLPIAVYTATASVPLVVYGIETPLVLVAALLSIAAAAWTVVGASMLASIWARDSRKAPGAALGLALVCLGLLWWVVQIVLLMDSQRSHGPSFDGWTAALSPMAGYALSLIGQGKRGVFDSRANFLLSPLLWVSIITWTIVPALFMAQAYRLFLRRYYWPEGWQSTEATLAKRSRAYARAVDERT